MAEMKSREVNQKTMMYYALQKFVKIVVGIRYSPAEKSILTEKHPLE